MQRQLPKFCNRQAQYERRASESKVGLGFRGEQWVRCQLEMRGYEVELYPKFNEAGRDGLVNGLLEIEVKFANPSYRKGRNEPCWQFDVCKVNDPMQLVIMVANFKGQYYPYIVPGDILIERVKTQLTSRPSKYSGYLSHYLERWDLVEIFLKMLVDKEPNWWAYAQQIHRFSWQTNSPKRI